MVRLQQSRQSIVYFTNPDNNYVITNIDENGNEEKKLVEDHIQERNTTTIVDIGKKYDNNATTRDI